MKIKTSIITLLFFLSYATLFAQERGVASYYSNKLHGRFMSDGTRYHKDSMTCAHKRYPLGIKLKVTNLKNGKSVVVKVTDRCTSNRIDLSYAAAKQIDIIRAGIATVNVERYIEPKGIPFKLEKEEMELPELDFEVTEDDNKDIPQWQKSKEKSTTKAHNSQNATGKKTHPKREEPHNRITQ